MKKFNFLLLSALFTLCAFTLQAQFVPEDGKYYLIKHAETGLYLDSDGKQALLSEYEENSFSQTFSIVEDERYEEHYRIIQLSSDNYLRRSSGDRADQGFAYFEPHDQWYENFVIKISPTDVENAYTMLAIPENDNRYFCKNIDNNIVRSIITDTEKGADLWLFEEAPEIPWVLLVQTALDEALELKLKIENFIPESGEEQQIGQYEYEAYMNLLSTIEAAEDFIENNENTNGQLLIDNLKAAIDAIPATYKYEINTLGDGQYFITVNGKYITTPVELAKDIPLEIQEERDITSIYQLFDISIVDAVDRYKILPLSNTDWSVTEKAVLQEGWDNNWRSLNIYHGIPYAIQAAGSGAAQGFWGYNPDNNRVVATQRKNINTIEDFIFDFISINDVFVEEIKNGEELLDATSKNIGFDKGQYLQSVYNEFKTAWEKANSLLDENAEITVDNLMEYGLALAAFAPNEKDIVKYYAIKNITNDLYLDSEGIQALLTEREEASISQLFVLENEPTIDDEGESLYPGAVRIKQLSSGHYLRKQGNATQTQSFAYITEIDTKWPDNFAIFFEGAEDEFTMYAYGESQNDEPRYFAKDPTNFNVRSNVFNDATPDIWALEEVGETIEPLALKEAVETARQYYNSISTDDVANNEFSHPVGKYGRNEYNALNELIEEVEDYLTDENQEYFINEVIEYIEALNTAVLTLRNSYKTELNEVSDGDYYITINGKYFTIPESLPQNDVPLNLNDEQDTNTLHQIFTITKWEEVERYQILSTEKGWNITEKAVLRETWGDSDHNWRTVNFLSNGSKYAIQSAGSGSQYGFWGYDSENNQPTVTSRIELDIETDFIFNFIPVSTVLAEKAGQGEELLSANEENIGDAKGQYNQDVYEAFKAAVAKAKEAAENGTATGQDLLDYNEAVKKFVPNSEDGIDNIEASYLIVTAENNAIKVITNQEQAISIYNVSGILIHQSIVNGETVVSVPTGIYIVKTEIKTVKVAVN